MCTLSWTIPAPGAMSLCFNRDEQKTRSQGRPPDRFTADGRQYLAPTDPDAGGTWIAVSEAGLSLALLNYTQGSAEPPERPTSRGLLIPSLMARDTLDEVDQHLLTIPLQAYRPFLLVGLQADGFVCRWCWDGRVLDRIPLTLRDRPVTTSSRRPVLIQEQRRRIFDRILQERGSDRLADLRAGHASHRPRCSEESICMHREDAETVSYTEVEMTEASVTLSTASCSPCRLSTDDFIRKQVPRMLH